MGMRQGLSSEMCNGRRHEKGKGQRDQLKGYPLLKIDWAQPFVVSKNLDFDPQPPFQNGYSFTISPVFRIIL